jgi:hypothetical protein
VDDGRESMLRRLVLMSSSRRAAADGTRQFIGARAPQPKRKGVARLTLAGCVLGAVLGPLGCNSSGFKDAYMALDGEGNRQRDVFQTENDQIYCIAEMASGTADVSVVARVRVWALYDPLTGERQERAGEVVGAEEQAPGAGTDINAVFLIEKPDGSDFYPAGVFTCDLYLDGELEESLDFEIRYPDCPFEPVAAGSACAGLVLLGNQCPSPAGGTCTCAVDTGLWSCG